MKLVIGGLLCLSCWPCLALDREAFTFTHYDLNVRVEPEQQRLGVRGRVTLRNDSAVPQKHAVLQISSSLAWRSIQAEGKPLQFVMQPYTSDIDHTGALSEAIVTLPREISPKGTIDIDLGYEGVIPLDTTRLTRIGTPKEIAAHNDWDQISKPFTGVRGIGYVAWYPVATEAASFEEGDSVQEAVGRWKARAATSSVRVNLCQNGGGPNLPRALMNDWPAGVGEGSGGGTGGDADPAALVACLVHVFDPVGTITPAIVIANFQTAQNDFARLYLFSAEESAARDFARAALTSAPMVKDWLGNSWQPANIAELPDASAVPYESGLLLLTPLNAVGAKLGQITMVHELAHAALPSPRPWIYEGVAHFIQALYREKQDGRQAALDYLGLHLAAIIEAERSHSAKASSGPNSHPVLGNALVDTFDEVFYRSKAAYIWWMLRDMLGDEVLKRALQAYRPEQDKEPSYMQRLIEASAKRDLGWFFDDWVYHDRGLPDFKVASAYSSKTPQGYLVTVTVENLGLAGAEVPVTLRMQGGQTTKRLLVRGKAAAVARFEAPAEPQAVAVNDGSVPETDTSNNVFKIESTPPH
jgi:hypothetical protein